MTSTAARELLHLRLSKLVDKILPKEEPLKNYFVPPPPATNTTQTQQVNNVPNELNPIIVGFCIFHAFLLVVAIGVAINKR